MLVVGSSLPASHSRLLAYGWLEAGWLRHARRRRPDPRAFRRPWTGCGSGTSPTSTSAPRSRAATARASARCAGSRSASRTSSASPETSSPTRVESRCSGRCSRRSIAPLVVLGNHDVAVTRDPFSKAAELRDLERTRLLRDEVATVDGAWRRGRRRRCRPGDLSASARPGRTNSSRGGHCGSCSATFPGSCGGSRRGSFDLILAGHLHAGQICLPLPGRRITLAHPRARSRRGRRTRRRQE